MPAAPAVYAPRLGPASSACVLLPAQVSRLRRLPFAAVAHSGCAVCPSRRCAYTASALGMACRGFDMRRSGRFLAAARTPLRRPGCYVFLHVRRWLWGVGSVRVSHRGGCRRLTLTHGRRGAESASPTGSDAHAPASEPDSVPSDTMPRKSAPKPLTGPRGLPNRKSGTRRPSRGAGARAPGRSRRPHRRRDHPAAARAPVRPHGRLVCASAPAGAAASLASDIISSAPARPSPAPRGVARAPAPRPGLRCRHPNRRGSQRTRQTPLRTSQRPRPRRTTWLGTPTAP